MKLTKDRLKQIIKEELEEIMTSEGISNPMERFMALLGGTPQNPVTRSLQDALDSMPTDHERDVVFQYLNSSAEKFKRGETGIFSGNPKLWSQWRQMRIAGGHPDPDKSANPVAENKRKTK